MSEDTATEAAVKIFQQSINEQKQVKENNEEIKNNILTDIELAGFVAQSYS